MRITRNGLAGLLLAGLIAPVGAAPLAHRDALSNGTRLLVGERPGIPIVVVDAYLRAGSAVDPSGAPGLANLTAELITRGTRRRSGPELDRAIEFVGGSLGAEVGRDGVTVSLAVLKKDLDLGLDLLAEVLLEPTFPEDELRRKVSQIQAALRRSEESPETVAGRELAALIFGGHPYAHQVSGTVESVGALTREDVVRFHREHYRPDAALIVAVGDVARDEIKAALERRLARWTAPASPAAAIPRASTSSPALHRRIDRNELTQTTLYLGRPAIRQDDPDYFALAVANYILGGGSASRLYTRLREERGLVYGIFSSLGPLRHGASLVVSLQTRSEAADEALTLTKEEMLRLGREEVSPPELDLARSYLIGSFPLRLNTSGKVAGFLIAVEDGGLGLDYPARFKEQVARVTAADVRRVAARYFDPAGYSSVVVGKRP
jgi:zinc protease